MEADDESTPSGGQRQRAAATGPRLDKWLWFARTARTRTLAATLILEGKIRLNGTKVDKPAQTVRLGDVVTIVMRERMRVLKVTGFAEKRGSATLAAGLFEDLSPPPPPRKDPRLDIAAREPGSGRPTKRDRRATDRLKYRQD